MWLKTRTGVTLFFTQRLDFLLPRKDLLGVANPAHSRMIRSRKCEGSKTPE